MSTINSFTIYKDYYDLITLLSDREQANVMLAIVKYMFADEEIKLTERENKVFVNLKRPLDKSKNKSKNANKIKSNQNQNEIKSKSNEYTHHDVNVNVHDNVYVNNLEEIGCGEEKPLIFDDVSSLTEITKKVIEYLNTKTNSNFRYSSKATQTKINARLNEGYSLNDFIVVIDKKYAEWKNTEFEKYLCPETLFGTKFEKYLNQKVSNKEVQQKKDKTMEILKGVYNGTIKID